MQWTITINFVSCKDNGEECVMNSKSDSIELYDSLIKKYQIGLEKSMRGSDFIFDCVIYYIINVIKEIRIMMVHI